ncbi:YrzQ family protein [Pontibacillus litoralis]|uniref:DUF3918 domain-containing protein n=1 Tax=Pontibacillus litoralis JSM 072002 TaxID=1385512 RepID=A0A0A5G765_9BACI|nr:YrzQ family protein [Pontibacillus litoralis]KGX88971.1 hypothetical protein N784_01140 [Pontibacillus litoralis JSM 072002]
MNRTLTSLVALGIGAAIYSTARDNDAFSQKSMRRMRKKVQKAFR